MIDVLKRFFLVPKCLLCREPIVETDEDVFCKKCRLEYEKLKRATCKKCGKEQESCRCLPTVLEGKLAWNCHLFALAEPLSKTVVYTLKRKNNRNLQQFLAKELVKAIQKTGRNLDGYAVSYAPRKPASVRTYGFDQAKILAEAVSEALNLPILSLYAHSKKSDDQKNLGKEERAENAKKSYALHPYTENYQKLLLIDDIITTGSTVNTLVTLAKEAGFTEIAVAYIARTRYKKDEKNGKEMDAISEKTEI